MPGFYPLMRAAHYIGVKPWKLAKKSIVWQDWALMTEYADSPAPSQNKPGDEWALK